MREQDSHALSESRRITLVVNPSAAAGKGLAKARAAQAALAASGASFKVVYAQSARHLRVATAEALHDRETPVAVGGDGTVAIVATVCSEFPGGAFGIVPVGRGNDFAGFLGLPTDPSEAAEVALSGTATPIDLAAVRSINSDVDASRNCLSVVSCGLDATANAMSDWLHPGLGDATYLLGALQALATATPRQFEIEIDGRSSSHEAIIVAVANAGRYGGGMKVVPDACIRDGVLDVLVVGQPRPTRGNFKLADRLWMAKALPMMYSGKHIQLPEAKLLRGRDVRVSCSQPQTAYADGDWISELPLRVSALPKAASVLLPPQLAERLR